jgi:CHAD domain-containing protein
MAASILLPPGAPAKPIGLEVWMDRVSERAERVLPEWNANDVHDLRVALRRSRTMADALSEVNPGSGWRKLKKTSRDLFQALGDLRDSQVERAAVKRLGSASDPLRQHLLRLLSCQERERQASAEQALDRFDCKEWKKLTRKLGSKSRFFPLESVVFQRLAVGRLNESVELYRRARERRSRASWHRLRIGLKTFRYIVENFLPQRYEVWAVDLKRMQDLLGDVHDLDVLRSAIRKHASKVNPAIVAQWTQKIDAERKARLREFLTMTTGEESPWLVWRAGFQWGHAPVAAPFPQRRTA